MARCRPQLKKALVELSRFERPAAKGAARWDMHADKTAALAGQTETAATPQFSLADAKVQPAVGVRVAEEEGGEFVAIFLFTFPSLLPTYPCFLCTESHPWQAP